MSAPQNLAQELDSHWGAAADAESCEAVFDEIAAALDAMEDLARDRQAPVPFKVAFRNADAAHQRLADLGCTTLDQAARLSTFVGGARAAMANDAYEDTIDRIDRTREVMAALRKSPSPDHNEQGEMTDSFPDGSIRFLPPFTKDEADYRDASDPDFDESHDRCADCVHFIPDEGCHFVQGRIDPEDYCAEFFADYGVFAHDHGDYVEVNAELVGPTWAYDDADIADFVDAIEERLQQRHREQEGSRVEGY